MTNQIPLNLLNFKPRKRHSAPARDAPSPSAQKELEGLRLIKAFRKIADPQKRAEIIASTERAAEDN